MRVSQKADYALRAMFVLAQEAKADRLVRTAEIAERELIPHKFLELILVQLRRAGMIRSVRGAEGGHRLARHPAQITVGDIWQAIDGPLSPAPEPNREKRGVAFAAFQPVWRSVENAVRGVVERVTLEDVVRRAQEQGAQTDFSI